MDKIWISFFTIIIVLLKDVTNGQTEVKVQLVVKKYVEKGASVSLQCKHNVKPEILYKVSWLRVDKSGANKFFEYINGRNPPFLNRSLFGAEIDGINSNEHQVTLKHVDFDAAGLYYCEVSTDTPIFTKASNNEQLHVILSQTGPPQIDFNKRHFYIGEKLIANCTTSKARPPPHLTWLIDGKKVDEKYTRHIPSVSTSSSNSGGKNNHRSKSHKQNHPSYDKIDPSEQQQQHAKNGMMSSREDDAIDLINYHNMGYEIHPPHFGHNFEHNLPESSKKDQEQNHEYYDNKRFDSRKHHSGSRKYRRYISDNQRASASQLSIDVSNIKVGPTGRVEITCLATIPAHVDIGEEFADYKTTSHKIDIEAQEMTSITPSRIGASPLDGNHSGLTIHKTINILHFITLIIFLLILI